MGKIQLCDIHKNNNIIEYRFEVTQELKPYFSCKPFIIEYPVPVEAVPDAVAAIPFVCNVLPIVWLTDSILELPELDNEFYDSIPEFKRGYIEMFPESKFLGEVSVGKLIKADVPKSNKCAAFFSGGLDAVNTLVMHMNEKPELISIWGSDIKYENSDGWNTMHDQISKTASKYNLSDVIIRSTFREFDNESELDKAFSEQLKDSWWHGVKHGIALISHAAPYAYAQGISTIYIASSNCPLDENIRCASHPTIDNYVRFSNIKVVHDGFEFSRQDKARNVVEYANRTGEKIPLHVCWKTQTGNNCCKCEKCYRTMLGLIAEGANPIEYGFPDTPNTLSDMRQYLIGYGYLDNHMAKRHWLHIYNSFIKNISTIKKMPYWKDVKWIAKSDFEHPETLQMPPKTLREWLSRRKFYQKLHNMKVKNRE